MILISTSHCRLPRASKQYLVRFRHPAVTGTTCPQTGPTPFHSPPVLIVHTQTSLLECPRLYHAPQLPGADLLSSTARTAALSNRCLVRATQGAIYTPVVLACCCWCCCRRTRCKEAFVRRSRSICYACDYLHGSADRSLFDLGWTISVFLLDSSMVSLLSHCTLLAFFMRGRSKKKV